MTSRTAPSFSDAFWIWPDSHHWDITNGYALFRREFHLDAIPASAPAFVTADQSYQLHVNGHYVGRGPARGFQHSWPYDERELAPYLQTGKNVLAIRAYNPGAGNFQYVSQGYAGLLFSARLGDTVINSDRTWKCRRQSEVSRDTVPSSYQLFPQEHIDLRHETQDWKSPNYDDSHWTAYVATRPWNSLPWFALEPRELPLLDESVIWRPTLIGRAQGRSAEDCHTTRDVCGLRASEGLVYQPTRAQEQQLDIPPTNEGHFHSVLLDFGKVVIGSLMLDVEGAKGGEMVDTLHFETLTEEEHSIDFAPGRGCRMAFGSRMICHPGSNAHTFYHAFGFRYLLLTVRDAPAGLHIEACVRSAFYPLKGDGVFQSSDKTLTALWDACAWTQRICSLDAYVDTPWREQAQWWGDARVQSWNVFHLDGDTRLLRRGIRQISRQRTPDGVTYGHAPTIAHDCILPDFTLIWMLTLWDYYWQTGSTEPFQTHREAIRDALSYFRKHTSETHGLVSYDPRFWLFLDWSPLFKEGYSAVYNLLLLQTLTQLARLHELTGDSEAARSLEQWAARLRRSLSGLINHDGYMRDGLTYDGAAVESTSIHAQVLAIDCDLEGIASDRILREMLVPYIRGVFEVKAEPSAYWSTYLISLLAGRGYKHEVISYIARKWEPMAAYGSTWEQFSPKKAQESHSHAWSAHPLFHLMRIIGGVTQAAPRWDLIDFSPTFIGQWAHTVVPTPHGTIVTHWEKARETAIVTLKLPRGVSARLHLPGQPSPAQIRAGTHSFTLPAQSPSRE